LRVTKASTQLGIDLKVFSASRTRTSAPRLDVAALRKLDLEEQIVHLAADLSQATGRGVILALDEIDRINTVGLASFIKAATSSSLRFVLVGVANSLTEILHDHQSIERKLHVVKMPPMTRRELVAACQLSMSRAREFGVKVSMTEVAVNRIAQMAGGFPWFVHVIGQQASLQAIDESQIVVTEEHVGSTIAAERRRRPRPQRPDS
jgi:Cdc6-like AAA superfamily ATPase